MKKLRKEVTLNWIILMIIFILVAILVVIADTRLDKLESNITPELYECEVTAWYVGQGYENHYVEDVLEWELDKDENEMTIEFVGGWIWINADDIDYICHTQD